MSEPLFQLSCRSKACSVIKKETPTKVLSCEFQEIFEYIFFHRTPTMAASDDLETSDF